MSEDPTRRRPGQSARDEARQRRESAESGKGWFGRLAARVTDPEGARSWEMGARGEERVGRRLDRLTEAGWLVLHDLPIGDRGANIDHLVLGLGGLFTINTKNTSGRVSVGEKVVFINGRATNHVVKARAEADRVAKLLRPRAGVVDVQPVLVYLADEFSSGKPPLGVAVVHSLGVGRLLRGQGEKLSAARRAELAAVLRDPGVWGRPAAAGVPSDRAGCDGPRRPGRDVAAAPPRMRDLAPGELAFVSVWMGAPAGRAVEVVRQARRGKPALLALMDAEGTHLASADVQTGEISAELEVDDRELVALQRALATELRG